MNDGVSFTRAFGWILTGRLGWRSYLTLLLQLGLQFAVLLMFVLPELKLVVCLVALQALWVLATRGAFSHVSGMTLHQVVHGAQAMDLGNGRVSDRLKEDKRAVQEMSTGLFIKIFLGAALIMYLAGGPLMQTDIRLWWGLIVLSALVGSTHGQVFVSWLKKAVHAINRESVLQDCPVLSLAYGDTRAWDWSNEL